MTPIKNFAFEVLNLFDDLAKPEIKNRFMAKAWSWIFGHIQKIVGKKSDKELHDKLFQIYIKLHSEFKKLDVEMEQKAGEKLGSPIIANVGDFAKEKKLIPKLNAKQTLKLFDELGYHG